MDPSVNAGRLDSAASLFASGIVEKAWTSNATEVAARNKRSNMFAICGAWADEWGVGRRVGCGQMSGAWGDDDGGVGRRVVRRDPEPDGRTLGSWVYV